LIQLRFESDKIVEDVTVDIDSGETTRLHQLPALPFRIFSGTDDISQIMTRVMGAFANVPE